MREIDNHLQFPETRKTSFQNVWGGDGDNAGYGEDADDGDDLYVIGAFYL